MLDLLNMADLGTFFLISHSMLHYYMNLQHVVEFKHAGQIRSGP